MSLYSNGDVVRGSRVCAVFLAVFLLGTLVLQLSFYPPAHAQPPDTVLFRDGFESGDFSAWNGTTSEVAGFANPPVVQSSIENTGNYAMMGTVMIEEGWSVAYKNLPANYTTLYVRCFSYLTALPGSSGGKIRIGPMIEFNESGATLADGCIYNDGGVYKWSLGYHTTSGGNETEESVQSSGAAIAANTWYCVEVVFSAGSGTGFSRMYVNGVDTVDATGLTNNDAFGNYFEVGAFNAVGGGDNVYSDYVDDVVANDTGPVGTGLAFENMHVSAAQAGASCTFSCQLMDSSPGLSSYVFGTNNTGSWVNDTAVAVSGSLVSAYATKILNGTVGVVVSYQWFANATSDLWGSSDVQNLTTWVPWFSMSDPSGAIVGNPPRQHGFDVVHTSSVVRCNTVVDGAVRKYLAYDTDPPAGFGGLGQVRLYYADGVGGPWTPYSGNPIMTSSSNGYCVCSVALVNGTFQMFVNNVGLGDVERFTSTNGVNFTFNETILTTPVDPWTNPFVWLNPNDGRWYLFWANDSNSGGTWSMKARSATSITDLASKPDVTVMSTTSLLHMAFPTVMYRGGYYWLLCESEPTNSPPWVICAFVSNSVTSGYVQCSNSPIATGDEACPRVFVGDDGVSCYLFNDRDSTVWYQVVRAVSPRNYLYLMLSVDPDGPTYLQGQSVSLDIAVLNKLSSSVNCTLTLTVAGPGGYGYFDFDKIKAKAGLSVYSFDWTVPNAAGTYVVEVSLVPLQLTAYDAAWLEVV